VGVYFLPHPLCPPLLQRRGGVLFLKGLRPFNLPLINDLHMLPLRHAPPPILPDPFHKRTGLVPIVLRSLAQLFAGAVGSMVGAGTAVSHDLVLQFLWKWASSLKTLGHFNS